MKCLDTDFLEGEGKKLDVRDIMIASIVKCHGLTDLSDKKYRAL